MRSTEPEISGVMRSIDLSASYVCPHPEEHDPERNLVCDAYFARETVLAWLADQEPGAEQEAVR